MKKTSLKEWINKFKLVLVRFTFTLIFLIGLSILCFLSIQKVKVEIRVSLWAFFVLGTLLNVAVTLYLEEFKKWHFRMLFNVLSIALLAVYCFTLPQKLFEYQNYQLIAFGAVFVLSAFFVSFLKKNNEIPFWNFSRDSIIQMFIAFVFANVLFAGLSLALLSLDKLFGIQINKEFYSNLAVICYVIFAPVYFLSNIPTESEKRNQKISFNKILKIFGLYILLPILAAYTLILYVYLFRIIIKWELPNGWVSTLVSVLGMVGFLCMIILYPLPRIKENKLVDVFSRYFPVLLFPLLILMSVGIFRRIGDYGLTINRCYVFILNLWLFMISIYLLLSQSKHVKWIVISFAIVAFLSSAGPWSVYNITRHSLTIQLGKQLNDAHLLKNGKINLTKDRIIKVDSITQNQLVGTIQYLSKTYGNESIQKFYPISIKDKSQTEILALTKMEHFTNYQQYTSINIKNQSLSVDTDQYHSFLYLNMFGEQKLKYEDEKVSANLENDKLIIKNKLKPMSVFSIPLKDKLKKMVEGKNTNNDYEFTKEELTINGKNYKLIITSVNVKFDEINDKIKITNFKGYLFY